LRRLSACEDGAGVGRVAGAAIALVVPANAGTHTPRPFGIFIGTQANYQDYRDILAKPLDQPDNVAPDYKTQASALLYGDPYDWNNLNQPDSVADYLRTYY
jgi:hypothetical protein